jgi:hypothetical protein
MYGRGVDVRRPREKRSSTQPDSRTTQVQFLRFPYVCCSKATELEAASHFNYLIRKIFSGGRPRPHARRFLGTCALRGQLYCLCCRAGGNQWVAGS